MLHGLIMAGGAGTRFWPLSRKNRPKQLLRLAGQETLLRQTIDRFEGLVPPERIVVMTNEALVDAVREDLPELPSAAVIGEPAKRDTAPCVGLAAALMIRRDPDATMVVAPADHVIGPTSQFQSALELAERLVEASPESFVTFGIKPTYPAEIFGYIERGERLEAGGTFPAYAVSRFREKPDRETAESYIASGRYYWNAGIFVWRAAALFEALRRHEPAMAEVIERIAESWGDRPPPTFAEDFGSIEGKSIDYAVMERAEHVVVIEAPFQWDDVGSWQALARLHGSDDRGNTHRGRVLDIGTSNNIVYTDDDRVVATLGVDNLIVVQTPDATLVARRDDEESIRKIVAELEARGWTDYL